MRLPHLHTFIVLSHELRVLCYITTEHCISRLLWDRTLHVIFVESLYNRVAGENAFSFHREILLLQWLKLVTLLMKDLRLVCFENIHMDQGLTDQNIYAVQDKKKTVSQISQPLLTKK